MQINITLMNASTHPPPFLHFLGSVLNMRLVGRISDSVIRQDHAILLGYAALTQPTNINYKQQV